MSAAITGRGVVTSLGEGADAFYDELLEGHSGIRDGLSACATSTPSAGPTRARRAAWTASPSSG